MQAEHINEEHFNLRRDRAAHVAEYFHKTMYKNKFFYMSYIFFQALNLFNVLGNMYLTNWYLNGAFFKFGWEFLNVFFTNPYNNSDPLEEVRITNLLR